MLAEEQEYPEAKSNWSINPSNSLGNKVITDKIDKRRSKQKRQEWKSSLDLKQVTVDQTNKFAWIGFCHALDWKADSFIIKCTNEELSNPDRNSESIHHKMVPHNDSYQLCSEIYSHINKTLSLFNLWILQKSDHVSNKVRVEKWGTFRNNADENCHCKFREDVKESLPFQDLIPVIGIWFLSSILQNLQLLLNLLIESCNIIFWYPFVIIILSECKIHVQDFIGSKLISRLFNSWNDIGGIEEEEPWDNIWALIVCGELSLLEFLLIKEIPGSFDWWCWFYSFFIKWCNFGKWVSNWIWLAH